MKRLFHIIVLTLALLGLSAPGLLAAPAGKHCARGAIWSTSPVVVGVTASAEPSTLPAPLQSAVCPDQALVAAATVPVVDWRGPRPLTGTLPALTLWLAEAELPPPRVL